MAAVLKSSLPPADPAVISLVELPAGVAARVVAVAPAPGPGGVELAMRLAELGFIPGECVRIVARGFITREPLAVRVGTGTFALRRYEASLVKVAPESAAIDG